MKRYHHHFTPARFVRCTARVYGGMNFRRRKRIAMKQWIWTLTVAAVALLAVTGCEDNKGGGNSGGGGSGGSGSGGGGNGGSGGGGTTATSGSGGSMSSSSGGMLSPGECRTSADCTEPNFGICLSPGAKLPCGICFEPPVTCATDTECAMQTPGTICERPHCGCTDAKECVPGCTSDGECDSWEYCSPENRCLPDPCAADTDCLVNFACTQGACGRKACSADADCNGFCVNSECYDMAGTCMLPPP